MREMDIRLALRKEMNRRHDGEPDTLIVEELGLCQGVSRVDLAVVNGSLHGYEIKSERDTLLRLPAQSEVYGRALEYVTIVVAPVHAHKALKIVPAWWGVLAPVKKGDVVRLEIEREPRPNMGVIPYALAQFLWRDEALQVLIDYGLASGLRSKPREVLWQCLASHFTLTELGQIVRKRLKSRGIGWRAVLPPESDGD
jgi:hypothetical protein